MKNLITLFFVLFVCTISFAQLSGDYYIPQGSNPQGFTSLAAACSTLTADGASGTVRFLIDDDLAEVGANLVITRSDLNATNNLVIKPAINKTPTISITGCTSASGATQYAGFTLNNTGFVTIDGSNTSGGTTRDLSFVMNDASGRDAINLFGNCDNVTVKNIKVKYNGIQSATTGRGIYLNGQATGASDNCVIDNCEIGENSGTLVGPPHGIGFTGSSGSSIYCMNGTISNNLIYANIRGINLFWHNGPGSTMNVYGNTISIMNPASGNVTWGILHQTYTGTTNFFNNRIHSITQKSSGTQGIYAFGTLNGVAGSGTVTNVYNNFIGGNFNHTGTGVPAGVDGISFQDNPANNVIRVYNNTVVMNDFTNRSTTRNVCIRFNPVASQTFEIRNNIFINNMGGSVAYVFHYGGGTALNFSSNYNNAYVSGGSAHIGFATSNRTTLSDWSTAFTPNQDVNSISSNVNFILPLDFHVNTGTEYDAIPPVSRAGTPLALVTTDIDGNPRDASNPDIGADEFFVNRTLTTSGIFPIGTVDNLDVNGSGIVATLSGNLGIVTSLSINDGTLDILGFNVTGLSAVLSGSAKLKLTGNYSTQVTGFSTNTFQGSGTIHFAGTSSQPLPAGTYGSIIIDNSSGVNLTGNVNVSNSLSLTNGLLTLGTNNLTLGASATIGGIPSAANMVVAEGSGELRKEFTSPGTFTFPIGDNTGTPEYSPIKLDFTSGSFSSAYAGVNLKNSASTNFYFPATHYINRCWNVTQSGISSFSCDISATYDNADVVGNENLIYASKYDGFWSIYSIADATNNILTFNGVTSFSELTGADLGATPVELSEFSASVANSSVLLKWKTISETNSSAFEVQRKSQNTEWTKIAEVTAAGNSNSPKDYSYTDRNLASGMYQYRIKMIDADGSYQFSKIVEAEINLPKEFSLSQNYPNPFNPSTVINYSLPFDTDVRLEIYSVNGELVRTLVNETQSAGNYSIEFNATELASGIYLYRMITKDFVQTKKMQLIK